MELSEGGRENVSEIWYSKYVDEKQQESRDWISYLTRFVSKRTAIIVGVFLLITIVLVFGIVSLRQLTQDRSVPQQHSDTYRDNSRQAQRSAQAEWPVLWGPPDNQNKCQKNESVKYSVSPVALEDIKSVQPIGELREGHIIPGDHGGIDYKTAPSSSPVKVFMPADGYLVMVEKHPYDPPPVYPRTLQHYHIYLEHSCTFFTGFVHLTEFTRQLLQASQELQTLDNEKVGQPKNIILRVPVIAGQQLGTTWSFGLLGMVTVDLTVTNKGYLKPESYSNQSGGENWRIHSVAGLDYFEEPLKSKIMARNPRTVEPRGGKIDFDIEGKLVGNWFLEGTNGLPGNSQAKPRQCGNWPCPYWEGHLALVYDYIDPAQLRVSVGYGSGLSGRTPFGVKGNAPDFQTIGVENGLVKYELFSLRDISKDRGYDTESPLITVNDEGSMLGTMLVQVVDKDTIKVEIFPGRTADQISGFTAKARIYQR